MKLTKIVIMALVLLILGIPVYATTVTGNKGDELKTTHDVTGNTNSSENYNGEVNTDVISFDIEWVDTSLEVTQFEEYGLIWSPEEMKMVKDPNNTTYSYALTDDILKVKVTNKSVLDLQVSASYQPANPEALLSGGDSPKIIPGVTLPSQITENTIGVPKDPVEFTMRAALVSSYGKDIYQQIQQGNNLGYISIDVSSITD